MLGEEAVEMDRLCGANAAARKERAAHPIEALQCSALVSFRGIA